MNGVITLNDAEKEQIQLRYATDNFSSSTKANDQNK